MAMDAAQLLAQLQQMQEANTTDLPPMVGMGGGNAQAYGPRTMAEIENIPWYRGKKAFKRRAERAAAGALDEQDRMAAAQHLGNVEQAPGMGQAARLQGIDPSQPGVAEAYGTMVNSGIAPDAALAQLTANPNINPAIAEQQAMAEQAQMGQFGSGIQDYETFQKVAVPLGAAFRGAENIGFIADVVETLTPAQINANGALKGQLQTKGYQLLSAMQALSENKASTLREGERKLIQDFLGNPDTLFSGIFSRDPVTIGKLRELERAFGQQVSDGSVGLDETTMGFLNQSALKPSADMMRFTVPEGAVLRAPESRPTTKTTSTPEEAQRAGFENLAGLPIF